MGEKAMQGTRAQAGNILVIDDDVDSRTWARVWLGQAGYTVYEAPSAEEGLAQAAGRTPDLILLDVMLPDLDGFEVTRRLRQDPVYLNIPIILVTILDDVRTKVRGLEAGANDFLVKPAEQAELLARVRTLLRMKRDHEELLAEKNKTALLYRLSRELNAELDLDDVLTMVVQSAIASLHAHRGSLILLDEWGGVLRHVFSSHGQAAPAAPQPPVAASPLEPAVLAPADGPPQPGGERCSVADSVRGNIVQGGLAGWVIQRQEAVLLADASNDPRWVRVKGDDAVPCSVLAVPLVHQEQVVGVLTLTHEQVGYFTPGDLDLLRSIASLAAGALVKAQLFETEEQEHRRLEAVLIGTDDAIVAVNHKGQITLLNPAAENTLGISFAEAAGKPIEEVLPGNALVNAFRQVQSGPGRSLPGEIALPDGRTLFFTISSIAAGPRGEGGWVAVMQDITHLKQLDRLKNEFVSIVSHDLRSPLATIHGYAEVLYKVLEGENHEMAGRIMTGARRLSVLVEELLDLGKIESGVETVRTPCHLDQLASEAVETVSFQANANGIALEAQLSPLSRPVLGSPVRLRQVLDNLIGNALKYTPSGGTVTVRAWATEDRVTVTVQDSGIGIPRAVLPRLFEKFYRVPVPAATSIPGTGLGLAIVKAIVEQHGGQVWVESEEGKGSTFGFALPLGSE